MAKLSAHGKEIGRVKYTTSVRAYFLDGKILENSGSGWKLYAKVKDGINPRDAFNRAVQKQQDFISVRPYLAAYRKELHSIAGMGKAWKLHTAIDVMPDDPDGVWSEACDGYGDNVSADVDDICKLCDLYKLAIEESKRLKQQAVDLSARSLSA